MIVTISETGGAPAEQVRDQIRGLISSGVLAANERLPSVRQLASDLRVAPGTIAKAYRQLEAEHVVETRVGAGTRVSAAASPVSKDVVHAIRSLAEVCRRDGVDLEELLRVIRVTWGTD